MTRNLKALGLALVAALAMSAMAASGAQAEGDTEVVVNNEQAGTYTFTAEQIKHKRTNEAEDQRHVFTAAKREIRCGKTLFDGTLNPVQTEVTVEPTYEECFANLTQPVTVTMNKCDYRLYGGVETEKDPHHFDNGTDGHLRGRHDTPGLRRERTRVAGRSGGVRRTFPSREPIPDRRADQT